MSTYFKMLFTAWVILLITSNTPGRLEAYVFPVIENVRVSKSYSAFVGKTYVYLSFDKIRGACSFRDIDFYLTDASGSQTLLSKFLDSEAEVRGAGSHVAGPWALNTSEGRITQMDIEITHQCHPMWKTMSKFHYSMTREETKQIF